MASGGSNQGRMVFDIRGRRKTAVKVVYAVLAVLMGMSLFLVVGPLNIGELFNSNGSSTEASKQFEEQAAHLEAKLKKDPENPELLLSLTRARVNAGNAGAEVSETTGVRTFTPEAQQNYEQASQSWSEYLQATDEPNVGLAQLMAPTLLTLAELSRGNQIKPNIEASVDAQKIVAEQRPNVNSLSTLAIYQNFNFEYKKAEETAAEAKKLANSKSASETIDAQMKETRERAEAFQTALKEAEKESKAAGGAKPNLENPLGAGGLGGAGLGE